MNESFHTYFKSKFAARMQIAPTTVEPAAKSKQVEHCLAAEKREKVISEKADQMRNGIFTGFMTEALLALGFDKNGTFKNNPFVLPWLRQQESVLSSEDLAAAEIVQSEVVNAKSGDSFSLDDTYIKGMEDNAEALGAIPPNKHKGYVKPLVLPKLQLA